MKNLLVILVFLLLPIFIMATDYYSVTADVLNVRNQPSKSGAVVGVVKKGDVVAAHSNDYDGWMKVSTSSVSGYVSSKYLRYSHSKDTSAEQSQNNRPKLTFKKIIGKILGWLVPVLLIILSLSIAINGDTVYDVFEDGTMVKRPPGGCLMFLIGLIWLGIKIYNLF